jgi:hypothetical protein
MAENYDIIIPQFDSGNDWNERLVSVERGGVLTATANANRNLRWLAGGTEGQILQIDALGDLVWATPAGGHTQNTDTGTTSTVFELDNDGYKIELTAESASKFGVKVDGGATYADIQAKDATLASVALTTGTVSTAPSGGTDIVNKTYADGILAAADAMIFKGTVGSGGTHEIAAFNSLATYNAGWTYRIITAGTVKGVVCEVGDMIIAMVDRAGSGNLDADWTVVQTNLDGAVIGPASATDHAVARFDLTTGKLIQDSNVTIDDSGSVNIPSGQAYKINNVALAATDVGASAAYVSAPANWNSTGTTGQVAWDGDYVYRCVDTNSWRRASMSKWS